MLSGEPQLRMLACSDDAVVLGVETPTPGKDALSPVAICYRRSFAGEWSSDWIRRDISTATFAGKARLVYTARDGTGETLFERPLTPGGLERVLFRGIGRTRGIAYDPKFDRLAWISQLRAGVDRDVSDIFADVGVSWFADTSASLGAVRRREGEWRVFVHMLESRDGPQCLRVTPPPNVTLSGEVTWGPDGRLALSAVWHYANGTKRLGILLVEPVSGDVEPFLSPDVDINDPIASPDGTIVAFTGTTVPTYGDHPRQRPYLLTGSPLRLTTLGDDTDVWDRPCAWSGNTQLLCIAEVAGRRRLIRRDLTSQIREEVPIARSVEKVASSHGRIVMLTSGIASPPALEELTGAGDIVTIENSGQVSLPGTARYVRFSVPGCADPLGAHICQPMEKPARGLVVLFHGGPMKSWTDWSWRWSPWPFVAEGFVVVMPDPPMSLGYTDSSVGVGWRKWRTGIVAAAIEQIGELAALSGLVGAPYAVMGGSFGGYLSMGVAAKLKPRLVVAHAAPLNLRQVAATGDVGWHWTREFGPPAVENAVYDEQAIDLAGISSTTRILLSHGLNDDLVPSGESLAAHRTLSRLGVRSEVAFFHEEGHALRIPKNVQSWYRWIVNACNDEFTK